MLGRVLFSPNQIFDLWSPEFPLLLSSDRFASSLFGPVIIWPILPFWNVEHTHPSTVNPS